MLAYIGFVEEFTEIVVGTSKATTKDTCQSCFRITAIRTGVLPSILQYKSKETQFT
jgi:hypothetical protein